MMRKVARKQLREDVLPKVSKVVAPEIVPLHGDATTRTVVKFARESYVNAVIEVMP